MEALTSSWNISNNKYYIIANNDLFLLGFPEVVSDNSWAIRGLGWWVSYCTQWGGGVEEDGFLLFLENIYAFPLWL